MAHSKDVAGLIEEWLHPPDRRQRTLGQLAEATGLSVSFLSRLAKGERVGHRPDTVAKLAAGLGVHPDGITRARSGAPRQTFREFVESDRALTSHQKRALMALYYDAFDISDPPSSSASSAS